MRVVYTEEALNDLEEILRFTAAEHPAAYGPLERRLQASMQRVGQWPESAQPVAGRRGIRVVPLVRYPYEIFYRVGGDAVEILHPPCRTPGPLTFQRVNGRAQEPPGPAPA